MSSGQEATCDCPQCVAHRGGTWDEVNGEAVRRVERQPQRTQWNEFSQRYESAADLDARAYRLEEKARRLDYCGQTYNANDSRLAALECRQQADNLRRPALDVNQQRAAEIDREIERLRAERDKL